MEEHGLNNRNGSNSNANPEEKTDRGRRYTADEGDRGRQYAANEADRGQRYAADETDRGYRSMMARAANGPQGYNANQIRLTDLLFMLRKRIVLILVCTGIGLLVGVAFSIVSYMKEGVNKQYQITTSIAVTSQNANGLFTGDSNNPDSADINLAEKMVDSVIFVLTSEKTVDTAIQQLNLAGISANDIVKNMKVQQYNDTQVIQITLYWRSAQEGVEILNAINEAAPDILIDTLKIGDVTVIDDPKAKFLIGGGISFTTWMLGIMVGLMAGVSIALLELVIKPTLLETDDMEKLFACEVIGEIPDQPKYFKKKRNLLTEEWDYEGGSIYDNFVSIAHIIRRKLTDKEHAVIFATSVAANEGKTNSVARLGVQLANLDRKVLLVDLDTRNPQLGGMFLDSVEKQHSLNGLYRGGVSKEEAIVHIDTNLDILPGILEEKPLPLDMKVFELIRELKEDYDIVILDTSPIGLVANTMGLSRLADYALLVVRFDGPNLELIKDTIARLRKSGTTIMGCIVNAVKPLPGSAKSRYGSGKYGYYTYYGHTARTSRHGGGKSQGSVSRKAESELEQEQWEQEHKKKEGEPAGVADSGGAAKMPAEEFEEDIDSVKGVRKSPEEVAAFVDALQVDLEFVSLSDETEEDMK